MGISNAITVLIGTCIILTSDQVDCGSISGAPQQKQQTMTHSSSGYNWEQSWNSQTTNQITTITTSTSGTIPPDAGLNRGAASKWSYQYSYSSNSDDDQKSTGFVGDPSSSAPNNSSGDGNPVPSYPVDGGSSKSNPVTQDSSKSIYRGETYSPPKPVVEVPNNRKEALPPPQPKYNNTKSPGLSRSSPTNAGDNSNIVVPPLTNARYTGAKTKKLPLPDTSDGSSDVTVGGEDPPELPSSDMTEDKANHSDPPSSDMTEDKANHSDPPSSDMTEDKANHSDPPSPDFPGEKGNASNPPASKPASTGAIDFLNRESSNKTREGRKPSPSPAGPMQDWLDAHNNYRSQYGVRSLTWSEDLVEAARRQTDKCVWKHTKHNKYGENIAAGQNSASEVVLAWVEGPNEREIWNPGSATPTHFTQVVWKETVQIGCAFKTCETIEGSNLPQSPVKLWACEYHPKGNVGGEYVQNVLAGAGGKPLASAASSAYASVDPDDSDHAKAGGSGLSRTTFFPAPE
ncbi:hypothetical protein Pst134EA_006724 [Puccinia striiformis f. sp. tritici]|uniref:hypothetical protein n=1 Tax=Puccinia striiformis f. sp. tritici TaxID=168172 RepID=UPI002008417E|nr:hypothetical protein Pst134EA_006724 [Puccinia striiformis f. sp. tritici]KAH9469434.1 hypothetical protein Pst134EA_006724 [Puccinia striiformis f. sp. tritici]